MRQTFKRLTKMTAGYGMIQWAGPFLSFIFTPIITRILSPADYGVTDYLFTISSALGTITSLALPQALTAHYNDKPTPAWKRQVVGSALAVALPLAIGGGLALIILAPQITYRLFGNSQYAPLLQLMGAAFAFGACGSLLTTAAQAELRVRWGMVLSLLNILCIVGGNVLFIVVLRLGVTGMVMTPVVTGITTCVAALVLTRSLIGKPSPSLAIQLVRSGLVLLPTMAAAWMLQVVDRFFLIDYVSTTQLGYYSIANKFASLLGVAMSPLYSAWTPLAMAMQHDPAARDQYAAIARYLVAVALMGSLALGLFATEILLVFTRVPYLPAAPYVGFLTYIHVFSAISTTLTVIGMINKQFAAISGSVILGALANILLNFALIPPYGVWGATIATAIGYAVPVGMLFWRVRRNLPTLYPMRLFVAAIAVQLALMIAGLLIPALALPLRVGLKLLVFSVLPLALIGLGVITRQEAQHVRLFVQHRLALAAAYLNRK
jgi:O-antigen/teichoic acid export membrane protein